MSQHLLHYLVVNASSPHQGRAAMAQIMESDAQSSLLNYSTKIVAQCARVNWLSIHICEN